MKEHVKYSTARNQLYGVKVAFRELREKMPKHHRTGELEQVLDILDSVIEQSCDAFEAGNFVEVLINVYVPTPLPGFEEYVRRAREAAKQGLPLTDEERAALEQSTSDFLEDYKRRAEAGEIGATERWAAERYVDDFTDSMRDEDVRCDEAGGNDTLD